ncbi:MAG: M14 family zinc carboxypeptidase [Bacteroidota bacterium]
MIRHNLNLGLRTGLILLFFVHTSNANAQSVEQLNRSNISVSWEQAIGIYSKLDSLHSEAKMFEAGSTDVGTPLHVFVISADGDFDIQKAREQQKAVVLINNGIHPGEPDGIDASIRMSEKLLNNKKLIPKNILICIIPIYNIDGSINARCCTRANQNGPIIQGFRGNARNLDLNRDFIKCDSENAKSFTKIFRYWNPDVFIDTHVSNGSDYQHVMTLISTQHNKLGGELGAFLKNTMTPALFLAMEKRGFPMAPYVNTRKYDHPPEGGIYGFMETPRYASGYAALYGSLSFVTETHMLKPFPLRVEATLALLEEILSFTASNREAILKKRKNSLSQWSKNTQHPIEWKVDTTKIEKIRFQGYAHYYQKSPVTGQDQLYYDRKKPFTKDVSFYDEYAGSITIDVPKFYVVPQAWREVIERLQLNRVQMSKLKNDTVVELSTYRIGEYKTTSGPYEGHYVHSDTKIESETKPIRLFAGDWFIPTDQDAFRYIVETLEPHGPDSFFSWGFFDSILQQKEWFSGYVFDGMAEQLLKEDPQLKKRFEDKKANDPEFSKSAFEQLYFIYRNSEWFEDLHRYPVYRVSQDASFDELLLAP